MPDWRAMAAQCRSALDRADLTERQRRVAGLLVKATLSRGRLSVRVPRIEEFARVTRMSRGNLSETFAALALARICQVRALPEGGAEYTWLADPAGWDVAELYSAEEQRQFLRDLDCWSGQVQGELIEPEPSLEDALAQVSAQNAGAFPNRERVVGRVPESGTAPLKVTSFKLKSSIELSKFETFKEAAGTVRDGTETEAMAACRHLLGPEVMARDGGKWRTRWRHQRGKVGRVFAALAEDLTENRVRRPGAHCEDLWKRFAS